MKLKRIIAAVLAAMLLLSACASTPSEEPASGEKVENLQTTAEPEEKPATEETIELQIPCFYNLALTLLPSDIIGPLEEYGASNFKKNADASFTCKISKSEFDKYIADSVSNYNEFVQGQEGYPVKELIFDKDYKQATFQGDPPTNFINALRQMLLFLICSLHWYMDPTALSTFLHPTPRIHPNSTPSPILQKVSLLILSWV